MVQGRAEPSCISIKWRIIMVLKVLGDGKEENTERKTVAGTDISISQSQG